MLGVPDWLARKRVDVRRGRAPGVNVCSLHPSGQLVAGIGTVDLVALSQKLAKDYQCRAIVI